MTEAGFVRVGFGDGVRGRRLPSGSNNVRVRYRRGTGLAGNLPAARLEKPARPHPLVDKLRQPIPTTGGGDMESAEALRRNAPASVLTLERAVSAADYAHLAAAHAAIWRARAFPMPSALRRARIEVVVVPAGGAALGSVGTTIKDFLEAHAQPGVQVVVREFEPVWLYLDITLRVVSAEYDPQQVQAQALARLKAAFAHEQRAIGVPLHSSDVYAVVETIAGVRNSSCRLASERPSQSVLPEGQRIVAGAREVVFLDAAKKPQALRVECEEFVL
jgi:predicted phage baseplate assembly protein